MQVRQYVIKVCWPPVFLNILNVMNIFYYLSTYNLKLCFHHILNLNGICVSGHHPWTCGVYPGYLLHAHSRREELFSLGKPWNTGARNTYDSCTRWACQGTRKCVTLTLHSSTSHISMRLKVYVWISVTESLKFLASVYVQILF